MMETGPLSMPANSKQDFFSPFWDLLWEPEQDIQQTPSKNQANAAICSFAKSKKNEVVDFKFSDNFLATGVLPQGRFFVPACDDI
jgi:hypothetical protein